MSRRTFYIVAALIALTVAGMAVAPLIMLREEAAEAERAQLTHQPSAPADLASVRPQFLDAVEAIQQGHGETAIRTLESFTLEGRAVEQYRLYYLATAYQLTGRPDRARNVLARLWALNPRMIYWQDAGFTLASLYRDSGDWRRAAEIYSAIAQRPDQPAVSAAARIEAMKMQFFADDPAAIVAASREVLVESASTSQATDAAAALRAVGSVPEGSLGLSPGERLERARNLIRDGRPDDALTILDALQPWNESARMQIALERGLALSRQRKFEESNKALEPLTSGPYKYAIPALEQASRNYTALASSINPERTRTVKERKRTGTRNVKNKRGKTVKQAVYRTVTRTVKTVDKKAQAKKDEYLRLRSERLKDLLQLPTTPAVRKNAVETLIAVATEKNQDGYLQELVSELVKIEPANDSALQRFWDKAWAAYLRGDHASAQPLFQFIEATYLNPNVKRQARYWRARSLERTGAKEQAIEIYNELASAPYQDLYAKFAIGRGGKAATVSLPKETRSWSEIADKEMPNELRLAYELNALGMARDARLEVQKNIGSANRRYGEAILGDLFYNGGSQTLAYEYMRRAWPHLATVEQDRVPQYFLDLYYPLRYEEWIRDYAERHKLDPYLVMGLIRQESAYDPSARSRVGATGLMQIMPATGRELAGKILALLGNPRLEDPHTNIRLGTYYLRTLINRFDGVEELAIAAYNGGQGNVSKWRRSNKRPLDEFVESIPFGETRNYVKRVTLLRSTYRVRDATPRPETVAEGGATFGSP